MLSDQELLRYSRHLLMPELGDQAQTAWKSSCVSIIGCGGLGHPAALYLASSGIGHLQLFDMDHIELSNLQRQIGFTTTDVGQSKAMILAQRLEALNPQIQVTVVQAAVGENCALEVLQQLARSQVVVDCTDNFATRYWVNRFSLQHCIPLVSAAATGMHGVVGVLNQSARAPCYNCLFDEQDEVELRQSCAEAGVFAPLLGQLGAMQASLCLQLLCGQLCAEASTIVNFSMTPVQVRQMQLMADPGCVVCGVG